LISGNTRMWVGVLVVAVLAAALMYWLDHQRHEPTDSM
jgi:hypothetical protein